MYDKGKENNINGMVISSYAKLDINSIECLKPDDIDLAQKNILQIQNIILYRQRR